MTDRFELRLDDIDDATVTVHRDNNEGESEGDSYTIDDETLRGREITAELDKNGDLIWSDGHVSKKEHTYETKKVFFAFSYKNFNDKNGVHLNA